MAREAHQKRTFLPYLRGIYPEDLRLGSLYINPLEPTDGLDSLRWEFMRDEEDQEIYEMEVSKWTRKRPEIDQPFAVEFETSKARPSSSTLSSLLDLNGKKNECSRLRIEGHSGRRIKIKNPEAFLEHVMAQPGVNEWIRAHASLQYKSTYGRHFWKASQLWMVTAVQHVNGGEIHDSNITNDSTVLGTDSGLVVAMSPGSFTFTTEANVSGSNAAAITPGYADDRIWAAQFMPVSITFGPCADSEVSADSNSCQPATIASFRLEDVPDLGKQGLSEVNSRRRGAVTKSSGRESACSMSGEANGKSDAFTADYKPHIDEREIEQARYARNKKLREGIEAQWG